ncbi:MAG TPA: hypothetical protein VHO29_16170 [Marmoricola sp.]|nr:hypothetical protein [Marmoricola sp.]
MQWDLGLEGLGLMAVMAIGFGAVSGLIAGGSPRRRLRSAALALVLGFGFGLFTSEVWFGWATEEELQPNIDGLSFDEVLLIGLGFSVTLGLVLRYLGHHGLRAHGLGRPGRHRFVH